MWVNKLNYGTFTGKTEKTHVDEFKVQNTEGDTIFLSHFRGKYVVVDCWYTYCGICYKKLPQVQEMYNKYKRNTNITVFALHSRITDRKGYNKENLKTGSDILTTRMRLSIPCYSIDIDDPKLRELGVLGYPTVLVFDRESNLVFRGSVENATKYIDNISLN